MDNISAQYQYPILVQHSPSTVLPLELVHAVDQAYFLHLLVMDPYKVIPSGKSLLSIVAQVNLGGNGHKHEDPTAKVQERVADAIQAAFWDATAEKLSSPDPSEQNIHLRRLSNDIRETITSLLPPGHPLLHVLSLPPAPSIAPLYSFVGTLKDVLMALRRRCSPVRDQDIDAELQRLDDLPPKEGPARTPLAGQDGLQNGGETTVSPLARIIVQSLRAITTISDKMKSDLHNVLLGCMTEEQIQALVKREAKLRERDLVIKLWSFHGKSVEKKGEDIVREQWRNWCKEVEATDAAQEDKWKTRLIKALSMPAAVSCTLPHNITNPTNDLNPQGRNELPPQFFFSTPLLYRLQDFIQAVTIAAALRSLTWLPSSPSLPGETLTGESGPNFMHRVWSLLHAELDTPINSDQDSNDPLKVTNLADEVIRARRMVVADMDRNEEQRLREAVERTLQPHNPVFLLLQKRLMAALLNGILRKNISNGHTNQGTRIPAKLRTGRDQRDRHAGKRPRLFFDGDEIAESQEITLPNIAGLVQPVKGFEDPTLVRAIDDAFVRLVKIVDWIENVWGDLV